MIYVKNDILLYLRENIFPQLMRFFKQRFFLFF